MQPDTFKIKTMVVGNLVLWIFSDSFGPSEVRATSGANLGRPLFPRRVCSRVKDSKSRPRIPKTSDMTYKGLGEMFEGNCAETCAEKFLFFLSW